MADTIEQVVRRVRAHCPLAPPLLALEWVQEASNRISDERPWSFLRGESQIVVNTGRSVSATATLGSATLTGNFLAADQYRQIRVSSGPPFTITAVVVGVSATIDQSWRDTSGTFTFQILDAYVTMSSDFGRFVAVLDPPNGRQLLTNITEEEVNFYDPRRSMTGNPRALVSRRLSSSVPTPGLPQYELVPYITSQKGYPFYYIKRPPALTLDSDLLTTFGPILAARPDLLLKGALIECSKWPGAAANKNLYYGNMDLLKMLQAEFTVMLAQLEARDEEIYSTWLEVIGLERFPYYSHPFVSADIRASDIDFPVSRYW